MRKPAEKKISRPRPDPIAVDTGGVAWIAGTRIKVIEIVFDKLARGGTAREIKARFPGLTLRQVTAALNYFRKNQDVFRSEVERRWQMISQLGIRDADSPFQRRLKLLMKK